MTLDVAVTPLIVVVKVLPESDWANELIRLVKALVTPFTTVAKELVVVESVFAVITVVVATTPLIVLERMLPLVLARLL
jgi:hypothetical protein